MVEHVDERFREVENEELALLARAGDREARNALYLRLESRIGVWTKPAKDLLARHERDSSAIKVEDLVQESFILFCELLDDWEPARAPFVGYAKAMMLWRAYRYLRSSLHLRSTRKARTGEPLHVVEEETGTTGRMDPEALVIEKEAWNELMVQVRDDWKRFVSLKFYEGLSSREIARVSRRTPRTVNRALKAALDLLRQYSLEEWESM